MQKASYDCAEEYIAGVVKPDGETGVCHQAANEYGKDGQRRGYGEKYQGNGDRASEMAAGARGKLAHFFIAKGYDACSVRIVRTRAGDDEPQSAGDGERGCRRCEIDGNRFPCVAIFKKEQKGDACVPDKKEQGQVLIDEQ